jgi:hypothetical protein
VVIAWLLCALIRALKNTPSFENISVDFFDAGAGGGAFSRFEDRLRCRLGFAGRVLLFEGWPFSLELDE